MSFKTYRDKSGGNHDDGGFTMIELIIVVAVLGVLAGIVVSTMTSQHARAARAACDVDARGVVEAQEARRTVRGTFAPDIASLVPEFLRSTPRNTYYVITTDSGGTVYVSAPPGLAPSPVNGENDPCGSIG